MGTYYFSSQAAKKLGIAVSTLRKYALLLEGKGYHFERGSNNGRMFAEEDLALVTKMMDKMSQEGLSLDEAVAAVTSGIVPKQTHPSVKEERYEQLFQQIKQLEEKQTTLMEMNQKLTKQVEMLAEKIEERERDQQLFQLMEESRKKKKRKGVALFRPLTFNR